MVKQQCKGCVVDEQICSFHIAAQLEMCPCKECLVKPMCHNQCDKRVEMTIKARQIARKYR